MLVSHLRREAGVNVKLTSIVNFITEFVVSWYKDEVMLKKLLSGLLLKLAKFADN